MANSPLERWLRRRRASEASASVALAILMVVLGSVVLFLTFWLAYAMVWIVSSTVSAVTEMAMNLRVRIPHGLRLWVAGGFLVALCAEWLRRSVHDLGDYSGSRFSRWVPQSGGFGALAQLLAHPAASSRMIAELLYTGPRLLTGAMSMVRRAKQLRNMDPAAMAWLLSVLLSRPTAFSYEELRELWLEADWNDLLAQARGVDGLVTLDKGLSLTADFRSELSRAALEP